MRHQKEESIYELRDYIPDRMKRMVFLYWWPLCRQAARMHRHTMNQPINQFAT